MLEQSSADISRSSGKFGFAPGSGLKNTAEMAPYAAPLLIFLLWAGFVAAFIGFRGLWNPDEPRYLQVAWEMAVSKHFFVPTFNGLTYAQKPPLLFWLAILLSHIMPFEYTTQAVSALSGLGTLLLTYGIGARLSGRVKGLCAALILMSGGLYAWMMHTGNMDTLLTFFTTLAIYCLLAYREKGHTAFWYAASAACGMAVLAKGPVGFIIPMVFFITLLFFDRKNPVKPGLKTFFIGLAIALVPVLCWLVPACIIGGGDYTRTILFKQNFGRAVSSFAHKKPWYYFIEQLPVLFLPWSILLIAGVYHVYQSFREKNRDVRVYVSWFLSGFIFFSLVSGKRGRYLLPLFPALSLLAAHVSARLEQRGGRSLFSLPLMAAVSGLALLLVAFFPVAALFFAEKYWVFELFHVDFSSRTLEIMYVFCISGAACIWLAIYFRRKGRVVFSVQAIALSVLAVMAAIHVYYIPAVDPAKSVKEASQIVASLLPPGGRIAFYKSTYNNGWNFYLKKKHIDVVSPDKLTSGASPFDLVIAEKRHVKDRKELKGYRVAEKMRAGGDIYYFFVPKNLGIWRGPQIPPGGH